MKNVSSQTVQIRCCEDSFQVFKRDGTLWSRVKQDPFSVGRFNMHRLEILSCPACRLQSKLQKKEAEDQEKMTSTQDRMDVLQKQAEQADGLMETLAGSRQKISKLAGERESHVAAALVARQAQEVT